VDDCRLNLVRSFVETDEYVPATNRQDWVVFAGRMVAMKNPLLFIEAIPDILRKTQVGKFFMLGTGPLDHKIQQRLSELGIGDKVELGFRSDIHTILSSSLIFVSLQSDENYPSRALMEAMSCGNAVVATDVGYTHLLVNEYTGIRIPADSQAVADAIVRLLNDREETVVMGRCARELVIKQHGLDRYLRELAFVYEKASSHSRRNGDLRRETQI